MRYKTVNFPDEKRKKEVELRTVQRKRGLLNPGARAGKGGLASDLLSSRNLEVLSGCDNMHMRE